MDQVLRIAKSLKIPKWRALRIKVTREKLDAEAELEELSQDPTVWDEIPEWMARKAALRNVLAWMDQIEEAIDQDERARERARNFDGWTPGEW